MALTFASIFAASANEFVEWIPAIPGFLIYPVLVASVAATAVVNILLHFGRPRGWLDAPCEPVPFRPLARLAFGPGKA